MFLPIIMGIDSRLLHCQSNRLFFSIPISSLSTWGRGHEQHEHCSAPEVLPCCPYEYSLCIRWLWRCQIYGARRPAKIKRRNLSRDSVMNWTDTMWNFPVYNTPIGLWRRSKFKPEDWILNPVSSNINTIRPHYMIYMWPLRPSEAHCTFIIVCHQTA